MYMGTISYTMYLTHTFFLSMKHSPFVELGLTAGYASLSWFLIEKPLLGDRSLATFLAKALRIARSSHVESHPSVNINGNNVVLPQVSRSPAD
jgi:peptidoglycan/LPS O-acetylase OafA/YrhL